MARGQGWEPGEEAETDLEQGAETGGLGREERRDGLTSEPRDRRQRGREGASVCHYTNTASHALTPPTAHPSCNLCLLRSLNKISLQVREIN